MVFVLMIRRLFLGFPVLLAPLSLAAVEPTDLRLPTENHALLDKQPDKFYMYVERTFEGQTTKPWEAGSFGFVRSPDPHRRPRRGNRDDKIPRGK